MDYFNLHTHQFSNSPKFFELVNQYPKDFDQTIPFYSIGIHPWHCNESTLETDLNCIESKLTSDSCLAIGECGLDKRIETPFEFQTTVFERQLLLAQQFNKPVIIHCVGAFQELIAIKNKLNCSVPMIIHGFSKNEKIAHQLIQNGFYLSFGKQLLRDSSLEIVFKSIPNNRFFLETDTIEEGIEEVYFIAAKYKEMEIAQLQQLITTNFELVFTTKIKK